MASYLSLVSARAVSGFRDLGPESLETQAWFYAT